MANNNYRPKECMNILESNYNFVSLLYNEKLPEKHIIVCKNNGDKIKIRGNSHIEVLRKAVDETVD